MRRSVVVVDSITNEASLTCPSLTSWRAAVRRSAIFATVQPPVEDASACGAPFLGVPRAAEDCGEFAAPTPRPDRRAIGLGTAFDGVPWNEEAAGELSSLLLAPMDVRLRGGGLMAPPLIACCDARGDLELPDDTKRDEG